jgi:hypothetical protein
VCPLHCPYPLSFSKEILKNLKNKNTKIQKYKHTEELEPALSKKFQQSQTKETKNRQAMPCKE